MPAPVSPDLQSAAVERLRTAGCVFAEDEARLLTAAALTPADLAAMVDRRVAGVPLEYILGWAEFCGLRIAVMPRVFVPRRRTEFLALHAIALADAAPTRQPVVLDLCCGSGAVGGALVAALNRAEVHAADIDPAAVRCARRNIGDRGRVYEGDLFEPLPICLQGRVHVVVANAPYVPTEAIGSMPREARIYEARAALDGGKDGLDVLKRVIAGSQKWLAPGGSVLVESSDRQAPQLVAAFERIDLASHVINSGESGATIVIGTARMPMPKAVTASAAVREPFELVARDDDVRRATSLGDDRRCTSLGISRASER